MINTMGQGFSLNMTPVFRPPPPPPSSSIDIMSVYQPFPLRVDSFGEQGKQYDACFQIGEFPGKNVNGTGIVILVPLKIDPNPGIGGQFVNAFASKIPNILGAQPDPLLGYPEVPAQTGANWDVSKVVNVTRPYYTWAQADGTRVIVMAEPILIAQTDMTNIQRLPVTPPEDVIHEIGTPILYRPAPPVDAKGNSVPCPKTAWQASVASVTQPLVALNKPNVDSNILLEVLLGIIGTLAIVIGVWFGVKMAAGPAGDAFKRLGDSIGSTLAGGYGAVKKATSGLSLRATPKPTPPPPPKPTPAPPPSPKLTIRTPPAATTKQSPPSPKTPEERAPALGKTNLLNETEEEFKARMRRKQQQSNTSPGKARTAGPAGTGLGGRRRRRRKTGRKV